MLREVFFGKISSQVVLVFFQVFGAPSLFGKNKSKSLGTDLFILLPEVGGHVFVSVKWAPSFEITYCTFCASNIAVNMTNMCLARSQEQSQAIISAFGKIIFFYDIQLFDDNFFGIKISVFDCICQKTQICVCV